MYYNQLFKTYNIYDSLSKYIKKFKSGLYFHPEKNMDNSELDRILNIKLWDVHSLLINCDKIDDHLYDIKEAFNSET